MGLALFAIGPKKERTYIGIKTMDGPETKAQAQSSSKIYSPRPRQTASGERSANHEMEIRQTWWIIENILNNVGNYFSTNVGEYMNSMNSRLFLTHFVT